MVVASVEIRPGGVGDVDAITDILNHYVRHTVARFETEPFSVEERRRWARPLIAARPPRLFVAVHGGVVGGFACAQPYRTGPAFAGTVEVTVYLAPELRARGVGGRLYERLFDVLRDTGVHRALAGIALPNDASVALHRRYGFEDVGVFDEYAQKNGEYVSSIWMQKRFG